MAYYYLFPEKDTTLYSQPDRKDMNTGHDEILEIVKERGSSNNVLYPSRILLKFKNEEIQEVIKDHIGHTKFTDATVNLQLTSAEPTNLLSTVNLNIYILSQSWDEGTGRYSNLPSSSNGASWLYKNNTTTQTPWRTGSFTQGSGSISSSLIEQGGGSWFTGSGFETNQQFLVGESLDTNFDVTDLVKKYSASLFYSADYPTGVPNYGFIIKKPDTIEVNTSHSFGYLQYFSTDTHTIHPPKLTFKCDDSNFHDDYTGSVKSGTDDLNISLYRNKETYNRNGEAMFRIHVRDKYPTRQFASSSNFLTAGYLQTSSHYSIRDAHTEQEVIPFDHDYTKLSADANGMYFKLNMKGLQPERYYRILFRHISASDATIYDNDYYFKVIR